MLSTNLAWLSLLNDLTSKGKEVSPRGQPCLEIIGYSTTIPMDSPVLTIVERKLGRRFMVAEAEWILSGRNDVASMAPYSREISKFSDDGQRFDGAYGVKIADQLRYVCDCLINDNDTRQAVMGIWRENPRPSKDVPCTIACQFFIRDRKLNCCDYMRSSDAWLGIPYDWFNFSMLSAYVLLELRRRDVTFNDVELGTLQLTAGSQHLYTRNLCAAKAILEQRHVVPCNPLNTHEFDSPQELVDHLRLLKDERWSPKKWLTDLIQDKVFHLEESLETAP